MFSLNEGNRFVVCLQGVDLRKGLDGLCGLIRYFSLSPTNGDVYVFLNKSFIFAFIKNKKNPNIIMEQQDNQLNIELSAEMAEGIYSNLAIISHSTSEFVVDFIRIMPGTPKANVKSRIILTPEHAKRLLFALQENITKFETQNGKIKIPDNPFIPPVPMGFGGGEA